MQYSCQSRWNDIVETSRAVLGKMLFPGDDLAILRIMVLSAWGGSVSSSQQALPLKGEVQISDAMPCWSLSEGEIQ